MRGKVRGPRGTPQSGPLRGGKGIAGSPRAPQFGPPEGGRGAIAAERPLYSELVNTRHEHDVHSHPTSPLRAPPPDLPTPHPKGFPSPPGPPSCSLSDGQASAAEPAFPSYTSSTAASPPSRPPCLLLLTPPPAIPCPTPRARAAALERHAAPPREVGPALFGQGLAPAPAVSLSSSARPYVPTLLAEATSARLSPPPTADPKPPPGPSGLGPPARRRARYRIAATPLPHLLLPGTPTSGGAVPGPPGYSERVGKTAQTGLFTQAARERPL